MKRRRKVKNQSLGQLLGVVGAFLFAGVILLLHVWLPVQAERTLRQFKSLEKELSEKKSLYETLNTRYQKKISLMNLDEWARENNPWRAPKKDEVLTIYENE